MGFLSALTGGVGSIVGNLIGGNQAKDAANKAWDRQKNVMNTQVQRRVADSVKAGLHPLAALGMSPVAGPPVASIGADWGSTMGNLGQDIGGAIENHYAPKDKAAAAGVRLAVERATLENELLRTQIASQRMRNIQQATPGISGGSSTVFPDGSLKPGDNKMGSRIVPGPGGWVVGQPGSAQQMADNYGDVAQEVYGMGRFAADVWNEYAPGALKWLQGFERMPEERSPTHVFDYYRGRR